MKWDIFHREREQAEILPCGLKVYREDRGGVPYAKLWRPKAQKPFANYRFRNAEQRERYIQEQTESYIQQQKDKEQRKVERRGTEEQLSLVEVDAIFHFSWGYEQTNCDFYQVTAKRGRMLTLREIGSRAVPGSQGFMSDRRLAVKDAFLADSEPITKRLQFSNGKPFITMKSYGWCELWDGKEEYCSWYA